MNDARPKKRPWFQLHLSTCVVLMVVAGAVARLNLEPSYAEVNGYRQEAYTGFPFPMLKELQYFEDGKWSTSERSIIIPGILMNILTVLVLPASVCEFLIRRRERKRAAQEPAP